MSDTKHGGPLSEGSSDNVHGRPWRWRNCRSLGLIFGIAPCPWDWHIKAWSYPSSGAGCEPYGMVWGIQFGPITVTLNADIGNISTGDWRSKFGLSEEEAWNRSERR